MDYVVVKLYTVFSHALALSTNKKTSRYLKAFDLTHDLNINDFSIFEEKRR